MRTFRIVLATTLATLGLSILAASPAGAATPASLSTFDQCQNQNPPPYTTCSGWTNGGLNNSNHYAEDMVVPQRATFATTPGVDYVFSVTYDYANGAVHGYDFLAKWNASISGATPCQSLAASLCAGAPSTLAMLHDPLVGTHDAGSPAIPAEWTLYGGTLVSTTVPTHSGLQATTTVTFHSNPGVSTVVLLFGGHLAVGTPATATRSWGDNDGASKYPGGSLSIRQTGSSRNNGINTNAIAPLPAAAFTITKTATPTTASPGDQVTYSVKVTNTGGQTGTATFTDDYDNNLTQVSTPAGCTQGSGSMTCTTNALAPQASQTFTYTANLPTTFASPGTGCTGGLFAVKNTATLASGTNVTAGTTGSASSTVCVNAAAKFTVTKTPRTTTAAAGGLVIYDVVVTNIGSAPGSTSFTDNYNDAASVVTLPSNCTDSTTAAGDKQFTCTTGVLATSGSGSSQTITYTMRMPASFTGTPSGCDNGGYPVINHVTGGAGTADATVCVTASPSFSVTKTPRSTTANAGDQVTYDVVVTNGGSAPGSTSFTDNYNDAASTYTLPSNCQDATVGSDKKFTCSTGVIDPGHSETITYTMTMPASFTGTPSCGTSGYPVVNQITGGAGSTSATVCVNASPSFTTTKTPRSATAAAGAQVIYDVVVSNGGTAPGSTSFTDNYDDSASTFSLPGNCHDTTVGSDKKFTCSTGVIDPGHSETITYTMTMPASFTGTPSGCDNGGYPVVNHVTGAAGSANATVCVTASPSFSVTKTPSTDTAVTGDLVTYTVVVSNGGSAPGATSFTDNYNDSASVYSLPSNCHDSTTAAGDKQFTCTTDSIDPGHSQTITYTMRMPASFTGSPFGCLNGGYPVVNHITGGAGTADATVCVTAAPTITVVKTPRTTTAGPGENVIYDVVATNGGTAPGSTTFTDNIDDSASIVTLPSNCTDTTTPAGDKKFTCTTGTINPGQSETVTYTIKMPATFTGTPSGCDNGGYPVVNRVATIDSSRSSATVCVTASPTLGLAKSGSVAFNANGDQIITYTIAYTNTGTAQANAVTITDAIPTGTVFSSCTGGCTTSGSPATATWAIAPIDPLTGSGSVQLQVKVVTNQVCSIGNVAQIRLAGVVAASSNNAVVNVTPVPDPTTAKSNGSAIGVQIKARGLAQLVVGLLNVIVTGSGNNQVITVGQTSSSQTGPGGPVANEAHLATLNLTGILSTGIIQETSSSVVTSTPAETRQTSTSEVAGICLVPVAGVCTVKSDTARAVASTTANGSFASTSTAGSTIENLYVAGVAVPVDLNQTTTIPLNAALFGSNSYVAINQRTSSSGLSNGRYVADLTVSMIHVKITNLALVGALDIVVAQATAHSDFPKTVVCSGTNNQSVSGHALAAKLYTGPLLADLTQGFVQISPLGGSESQHIVGVVVPSTGVAVNAQVADTSSSGSFNATSSTSTSWAEVAGDGTKPACVLQSGPRCVVEATAIRAQANSAATSAGSTSTDAGSQLLGLSVLTIPINGNAAPNTVIPLAGIGFIILNEEFCDNGALASHNCSASGHSGITVRAIRIVITAANNILHLSPGVELTVAEAHADTTFGLS